MSALPLSYGDHMERKGCAEIYLNPFCGSFFLAHGTHRYYSTERDTVSIVKTCQIFLPGLIYRYPGHVTRTVPALSDMSAAECEGSQAKYGRTDRYLDTTREAPRAKPHRLRLNTTRESPAGVSISDTVTQ